MITEDYVSFETAKLLKEKGFDEKCRALYTFWFDEVEGPKEDEAENWNIEPKYFSAPTLQMAMKWLREVHNILLVVDYEYECDTTPYYFKIYRLGENGKPERVIIKGVSYDKDNNATEHIVGYRDWERSKGDYLTYEEACEEAIKYCLKNLIKNEDEESDIPVPKTVDEAISTLEKILSEEDRNYLLENGAISMHNSLGRWIRNEWGLWTGSELKDELMNMNKGLNHPDDMSNYIIEEFIKYWNNKL